MTYQDKPSAERKQTDKSLHIERQKADEVMGEEPSSVEEMADAVTEKARGLADAVLATARSKVDQQVSTRPPRTESPRVIERERAREDDVLRKERADADESLLEERTEQAAFLVAERGETDHDLSKERARADHAVRMRDEFLGIVSHDLRSLLGTMVGSAGLIAHEQSRENHTERVLAHTRRIQRSGARMNRLIGDLVDLASIQAGSLAVIGKIGDLAPIVAEALDAVHAQAATRGLSLVGEVAPGLPPAWFDPARLLQVLSNLLTNAIKFTPPGGKVTLQVERAGEDIDFAVRDTGVGIPGNKREAIFERFLQVTDDRRGVGLGLYISKCIVQGHGGKIWVESQPGVGSSFHVTLPIHAAS